MHLRNAFIVFLLLQNQKSVAPDALMLLSQTKLLFCPDWIPDPDTVLHNNLLKKQTVTGQKDK